MNRPLLRDSIILFVITALFFLVTWPVWQWLWGEWMGNDYYSHGLLIPLVAIYLAIRRAQLQQAGGSVGSETTASHRRGPILWGAGAAWLLLSMLAYLLSLHYRAFYLAAFAMISLLGAIIGLAGPRRYLLLWAFPLSYLLLMVPLPFVERATYPLAIFAGFCGGGLVRLFGMNLTIVGNAVTLPNAELVIGAQCSGINSLMALTALMVLAAYLLAGPLWARLSLILAAIPFAILGNILRIASLILVARVYGANAAFIYYHDYSGFLFFVSILLLMIPLTRLLQIQTLRLDVI